MPEARRENREKAGSSAIDELSWKLKYKNAILSYFALVQSSQPACRSILERLKTKIESAWLRETLQYAATCAEFHHKKRYLIIKP